MPHDQAFQQRAGVRRYSQRRYSQRRRSRRGRPFLAVITAAVVVATGVTVISGLAEAALPQSVAPLIITGDFRVGGVLVCSSPAGPSFEQTAVDVRWDTGSGYPSEPQRETLDTTGLAVGTRIRCNSKGGRDSQPITLVDSALSNGVPTLEFVPSGSLRRVDGAPNADGFYSSTLTCEMKATFPDGSPAPVNYRWHKFVSKAVFGGPYEQFLVGAGSTIPVTSEDAVDGRFEPDLHCEAIASGPAGVASSVQRWYIGPTPIRPPKLTGTAAVGATLSCEKGLQFGINSQTGAGFYRRTATGSTFLAPLPTWVVEPRAAGWEIVCVRAGGVSNELRIPQGVGSAQPLASIGPDLCGVTPEGAGLCWGNGSTYVPESIGLDRNVSIIRGSAFSGCAIVGGGADGGGVQCWGANNNGELGRGTTGGGFAAPGPVVGLESGVTHLGVGNQSACAIQRGVLKCWGKNDQGEVGDGTAMQRSLPTVVSGLSSPVTALDERGSCAIAGGAGWCWGTVASNFEGRTFENYVIPLAPRVIKGLESGVSQISTAKTKNGGCAVVSGAAKCWGDQQGLGNGATSASDTAVQVSGLTTGVISVSRGDVFACAVVRGGPTTLVDGRQLSDGIACWGDNTYGQLGRGVLTPFASAPTNYAAAVVGLSGATSVASGYYSVCALVNGFTRCWGTNGRGEFGNGSFATSALLPVGFHEGTIGDRIFDDLGNDGLVYRADENGNFTLTDSALPNVAVRLTDGLGNEWRTTTDRDGRYVFGPLPFADNYRVCITAPQGFVSSNGSRSLLPGQSDVLPSDPNGNELYDTDSGYESGGELCSRYTRLDEARSSNSGLDFGLYLPSGTPSPTTSTSSPTTTSPPTTSPTTTSPTTTSPTTTSPTTTSPTTTSPTTTSPTTSSTAPTTTIVSSESGSLGNLVWNDANDNGFVDEGEQGAPGVEVSLYYYCPPTDCQYYSFGSNYPRMATTDSNGNYSFTGLDPIYDYRVCVKVENNYWSSRGSGVGRPVGPRDTGARISPDPYAPDPNNYVDNDDNGRDETIQGVELNCSGYISLSAEHPSNMRVDFGLRRATGSIGNLVWDDANNNGRRDAGEQGLAGVTASLYAICNPSDCPYVPFVDVSPLQVVTDANGAFVFTGLASNPHYRVCITLPPGYTGSTASGAGSPPGPRDVVGVPRNVADPYAPDPNNYVDDDDNGRTEQLYEGTFNCSGYVAISAAIPSNQRVDFGVRRT
jgi:hypothetical protein